MLGHDWLMLKHQPTTANYSAKSLSLKKTFAVNNGKKTWHDYAMTFEIFTRISCLARLPVVRPIAQVGGTNYALIFGI